MMKIYQVEKSVRCAAVEAFKDLVDNGGIFHLVAILF